MLVALLGVSLATFLPRAEAAEASTLVEFPGGIHSSFANANGEVVRVGSDAHVGRGEKAQQVVVVLGNANVKGDVDQDLVVVLGDVNVNGHVGGSVVNVLGRVTLGPDARIDQDCVVVGGPLIRDVSAHLARPPVVVDLSKVLGSHGSLASLGHWLQHGLVIGRPLPPLVPFTWLLVALNFIIYLVIALLMPKPVASCVRTLENQPLLAFGAGLLGLILVAPLLLILVVSGIGLILVPFVVLAVPAAVFLGKTAIFEHFGEQLLGRRPQAATPHPILALIVGCTVVTFLYMVPLLGILVWSVLVPFGLGAVVLATLGAFRSGRNPAPAPSGIPMAAPAPAARGTYTTPVPPSGAPPTPAGAPAPISLPPAQAAEMAYPPSDFVGLEGKPIPPFEPTLGPEPPPPPLTAPPLGSSFAPPPFGTPPTITAAPRMADQLSGAELAVLPRAGFWVRTFSALLDFVLLSWILAFRPDLFVFAWLAYQIGMWVWKGTTIGGIVCSLKVVRLDGRPVDWSISVVRGLASVFSFVALCLGFFWVGWTREKQSWHDKIAGTVIVRLPKGISLI